MSTAPLPVKRRKAARQALKASIMIQGLTGDGKSGLAIALAYVLADKDWDLIDATDTENASLDLFVGLKNIDGGIIGQFHVTDLDETIGYKPSYYIALRDVAIEAGSKVWIGDSISHAWQYEGGVLDIVNETKKGSTSKDNYAVWNEDSVKYEKNKLLPMVRSNKIHVITTVRVKEKQEYVPDPDNPKKNILKSLGAQPIQQPELKYEPDLVLSMVSPAVS